MSFSLINKLPASWQAGLVFLVRPILEKHGGHIDENRLLTGLGVGRASAFDSARLLLDRVETPPGSLKEERKKNKQLQNKLNEKCFEIDVVLYQKTHPTCWQSEGVRHQFSDEFKLFILKKKKEHNLDWPQISQILGIPEDTLRKFKGQVKGKDQDGNGSGGLRSLPENIVEVVREFFKGRNQKATVKSFTAKYPEILEELKLDYRSFSQLLLRLGFTSPRGIFLNNTGLDRIERFAPHCVWGTDGKQMMIVINGEEFRWVWQCLLDYKTTVLVGGLIGKTETTENLLEAIKRSKSITSVTPMAIVIDNRLSENLPSIRSYLDEMGIEIIKTFPGNSKSNGIVEGNFNIFEKWVGGRVVLNGNNAKQLSHSIAEMLTEVFTQLRNNQPRKGLSNKTAKEALAEATPLTNEERQTIQEKLKALANRLQNERTQPIVSERKKEALAQAIAELTPPNVEVFTKRLSSSIYSADMILQALSILKNQQQKHPEKNFDHTYFGGILRNLANQKSVETLYAHLEETYADHWTRMAKVFEEKKIPTETPTQACERLIQEYLKSLIPAHGMLVLVRLQAVFMLATCGSLDKAKELRESLGQLVKKTKYECHEKSEKLLRKIFDYEALVRQLPITA
jgi:hypothetical protein